MGLQHFENPQRMLQLYRQDPEHFMFMMGVIG
jgi:hypothetical protein